jgi:hypothetical protein
MVPADHDAGGSERDEPFAAVGRTSVTTGTGATFANFP